MNKEQIVTIKQNPENQTNYHSNKDRLVIAYAPSYFQGKITFNELMQIASYKSGVSVQRKKVSAMLEAYKLRQKAVPNWDVILTVGDWDNLTRNQKQEYI